MCSSCSLRIESAVRAERSDIPAPLTIRYTSAVRNGTKISPMIQRAFTHPEVSRSRKRSAMIENMTMR